MQTTGKIALICAVLGIAAVGLSGCASAPAVAVQNEAAPASFAPSAFQVNALADGVVSRGEYQQGFANYRVCMANSGYTVGVLDADSTIIEMRIPAAAVESGADDKCYQTEFIGLNDGWQLANQEQLADNALLEGCLSDRGLAVPDTRQEKVDALLNAEVNLGSCLSGQ